MPAPRGHLLLILVLAALFTGAGEAALRLAGERPLPGHPGASGADPLAYLFLHLSTITSLAALLLSLRTPRSWPLGVAAWLAVVPPLFVLVDHQARWRFFPELIQWDPAAHYLRVGAITLVLGVLASWLLCRLARRLAERLALSRRAVWALQLFALSAPLLLWWRLPPLPAAQADAAPDPGRPNILLLTIDTLRADAVGALGGPATPRMDALLRSGVRSVAWSPASWTRPAIGALLSGVSSAAQGSDRQRGVRPDAPWWPERLRDAGYHTAAIICNPHLERRWGFDRGFDEFEHSGELERLEPIAQSLWTRWLTRLLDEPSRRGDRMVARVAAWLDRAPAQPWFLWVHLLDPHLPYHLRGANGELRDEQPGPWIDALRPAMQGDLFRRIFETRRGEVVTTPDARRALRALYQREVRFTDVQVGELIDEARAASGDEELLWVLTSDHGEEFFEHGSFEHGHSLHGELLRVPFGIGGLDELPAGGEHPGLRLQDVGPTLLGLLDLPPLHSDDSEGLEDLLRTAIDGIDRSEELLTPQAAECAPPILLADGQFYDDEGVRLQSGRTARIRDDGDFAQFDLCADPLEQKELVGGTPPNRNRWNQYDLWHDAQMSELITVELDEEMTERLRALGYIE